MPGPFPDNMRWATQQQQDAYLDAQSAAAAKQYDQQQAAEKEQQQQKTTPLTPHQELIQRTSNVPSKVTPSYLDDMISYVDGFEHDKGWGEAADRVGRDLMVAGSNAVVNTAGAAGDFAEAMDRGRAEKDYAATGGRGMSQLEQQRALEAEDPAMEARDRAMGDDTRTLDYGSSPIWNHAKQAILDFRDHMQLQDPNAVDRFTQIGAQLAIPFMGASKLLEGIHIAALEAAPAEISATQDFGPYLAKTAVRDATMLAQKAGRFAKNVMVPGAAVDATALQPHAPRLADTLALLRQTEGRFGEALRTVAPDGSLLNHYINFLTDRDGESAAEGRFKNALDGAGVNAALSGLFEAVAPVLKQGTAGLRYLADNGVTSMGQLLRRVLSAKNVTNAASESLLDQPSELEKDPVISFVRTGATDSAGTGLTGSAHDTYTRLAQHINTDSDEGRFYKEVLGRLSEKKLKTPFVAPGTEGQKSTAEVSPGMAGNYQRIRNPDGTEKSDSIALYPPAFKDNATFLHTITHEGVHAAVMRDMEETSQVYKVMDKLRKYADQANRTLIGNERYGFKTPHEFVAEMESRPAFRNTMMSTPGPDGKRSVWDYYKDHIAGILGLSGAVAASPLFDKLLMKQPEKASD